MAGRNAFFSLLLMTVMSPAAPQMSGSMAAGRSAELCFGQVPTIVGVPGEEVVGTEGSDVVVTNGAFNARTLSGDDLLCITGVAPSDEPFYGGSFDTGDGKDRIDATGGEFPYSTSDQPGFYSLNFFPGPGRDEVLAGPHSTSTGEVLGNSVYAADGPSSDADADIINTGDGPDTVDAGGHDVVDLGGDNDSLFVFDEGDLYGAVFDGGEGRNTIGLSLWVPFNRPHEHHSWKINNRAPTNRLVRDGRIVAVFAGFSDFDVQVKGPLTFVGSDLDEEFNSTFLPPEEPLGSDARHNWPLVLDMNGGDDVVVYYRGGRDSRFDGGDGVDRFSFAADSDPDQGFLDLSTGVLRHSRVDGPEVRSRAVNFENARWWSRADATIRGTDGPNKIVSRRHKPGRDMALYGGRGDDVLRGGLGEDVLVGGLGYDSADGQGGEFDHCVAEVRTHCES